MLATTKGLNFGSNVNKSFRKVKSFLTALIVDAEKERSTPGWRATIGLAFFQKSIKLIP